MRFSRSHINADLISGKYHKKYNTTLSMYKLVKPKKMQIIVSDRLKI